MPLLGRRTITAAITLMSAAGTITVAAPAANADSLNCLADVYAVQMDNNTAIQDDAVGNTSGAAAADTASAYYRTQGAPNCYYNPSVPYNIYLDASSGFGYVSAAGTANTAGQAATALSYGESASTYLNAAITYMETHN
jgi:hypothetical protein